MKHNFPFLIAMLLFFMSLCVNFYQYHNPRTIILESTHQKIESSRMISMMLETETGKYEESKNNSWPDNRYVYNDKLSNCENGSKLIWDENARSVKVNATSSDKCYLYFDHKEFSKYILNLYQKDGDSNIYYHDKTGNYENSSLEAGDLSYRYSGSSEAVKNYVCLDGTSKDGSCQSGDADLYRIIGLFKNDQDQYEIKLIKYDYATKDVLGDNETAPGGSYSGNYNGGSNNYQGNADNYGNIASYAWNNSHGTGEDDLNTNMWQYSNLNKINLNYYLNNYLSKVTGLSEHVTMHKWTTGGVTYVSSDNAQQVYNKELGSEKITTSNTNCYSENDYQTAIPCQESDLTYNAKIGLMYVSDYGYAADPENWNINLSYGGYDQESIRVNNWLFMGLAEGTISRSSGLGRVSRFINASGAAGSSNQNMATNLAIRPAFYLISDTKLVNGDGSKTNPFRLSWN